MDSKTISIPAGVYDKIEKRLPKTEFKSVDEYATYVLEEVIRKVSEDEKPQEYTSEDEEKVKQRLKSLGYLE
jgi:hypothetical protein